MRESLCICPEPLLRRFQLSLSRLWGLTLMARLSRKKQRSRLYLEGLEDRRLLSLITVPLDPTLDQFGDQIITVQAYQDESRATINSIFDTGASAVTFGVDDQGFFLNDIAIKVPGGAQADGIGGSITGDVSEPGTILADGLH